MNTGNNNYAPTARLRWVERATSADAPMTCAVVRTVIGDSAIDKVLQCWWAEDVPGYMRANAAGEWRDVPVGVEAP